MIQRKFNMQHKKDLVNPDFFCFYILIYSVMLSEKLPLKKNYDGHCYQMSLKYCVETYLSREKVYLFMCFTQNTAVVSNLCAMKEKVFEQG